MPVSTMPQASATSDTVLRQLMANSSTGRGHEPETTPPLSVVVLASGTGTNLQAILDSFEEGSGIEVVGVASNKPDALALQRAQRADVPTGVFLRSAYSSRAERDEAMASWIEGRGVELVVLAGYLEILSPEFVRRFRSRIINVHPSLLPEFPGLHSIERAFDAGVRKSGVTVHIVDEGVDTGPKIEQRIVKLRRHEDLSEFERRIHVAEHELLPNVIRRIASGELKLEAIQESTGKSTFLRHVRPLRFLRLSRPRWVGARQRGRIDDPAHGKAAVPLR